ncbi:MAG: DMT family transporter [Dongiaceae bacterium]
MNAQSASGSLQYSPVKAMTYMFIAVSSFVLVDTSAKWLTASYSIVQILFFGRMLGPLFAIFLAYRQGAGLSAIRTRRPFMHAIRTLLALAAIGTYFYALKTLSLAETISIGFSAPLFMAILSIPMLGEKVGPRRWAAILVGLVGVVVILRPGMLPISIGAISALASGILYALSFILARRMSATEGLPSLMFWFSSIGLVATTMVLPFEWITPDWKDVLPFAVVAVMTTLAQFCITQAFRYGEVSLLAPLEYTALVWGVLYGWLIWGDLPDIWVFVGAGIMIASGVYLVHREHRLGKRQAPIAKTPTDV